MLEVGDPLCVAYLFSTVKKRSKEKGGREMASDGRDGGEGAHSHSTQGINGHPLQLVGESQAKNPARFVVTVLYTVPHSKL